MQVRAAMSSIALSAELRTLMVSACRNGNWNMTECSWRTFGMNAPVIHVDSKVIYWITGESDNDSTAQSCLEFPQLYLARTIRIALSP